MKVIDLKNRKTVIWGTGREGAAAAQFIRKALPGHPLTFIDEAEGKDKIEGGYEVARKPSQIKAALEGVEVIVKSPGVSLYHPAIENLKQKGVVITSLLNLWFAEPHGTKTVCITGTKGKSTTAALLAHTLNRLGVKTALAGNIGTPVTQVGGDDATCTVIEMSSYQAADFDGQCDIAVLTSLYPEHLDWHKTLETYYRDKLNLFAHAAAAVINNETAKAIAQAGLALDATGVTLTGTQDGIHANGTTVQDGETVLGTVQNAHLARAHNMVNICVVLTVIRRLGHDPRVALAAMDDFTGLPHRQHELGERGGILFVDDSISTTPQSAIAAMEVYRGKPVTLIAGGHDRGIDYAPLADYIVEHKIHAVICLGASGKRIMQELQTRGHGNVSAAAGMQDVIVAAKAGTPAGGVVLLSPAAPSYGLFKDFTERGKAFAAAAGFNDADRS